MDVWVTHLTAGAVAVATHAQGVHASKTVLYTSPFTLYAAWDDLRIVIALASALSMAMALVLAPVRWGEQRRSAAIFLVTVALALITNTVTMLHNLGHPGSWILWLYLLVAISSLCAALLVVQEIKKGVWKKL